MDQFLISFITLLHNHSCIAQMGGQEKVEKKMEVQHESKTYFGSVLAWSAKRCSKNSA